MIVRTEVSGRPAVVAYLLDDFTPVSKDKATLAKVIFDDGEVVFLSLRDEDDDDDDKDPRP